MTIQAYPAHLISSWQSPQGEPVVLRPIRADDTEIEQAFVRGLSPESRHFRFMDTLRELSPRMLARFTQIDYDREMAFVAIIRRDGREFEIGVCRYVSNADGISCEFAVVVADDWQRRGLGRHMMLLLIGLARDRGLQTMVGYVSANNHGMLNLCRSLGFSVEDNAGDPRSKCVTLVLSG